MGEEVPKQRESVEEISLEELARENSEEARVTAIKLRQSRDFSVSQGCFTYLCKCLGCSCSDTQAQVKNGVNKKNRSCTDLPFVFIFMAAIAGLLTIWGIAGEEGDLDRLLRPIDYQGNVCGKGSMADKPVGYWPDTESFKFKMCAENCLVTSNNWAGLGGIYTTNVDMVQPYPTKQFKSYCVPDGGDTKIKGFDSGAEQVRRMVEDLTTAFPVIAGSAGLTLIVGLIYVCLIKMCLSIVVWMATVCTVLASGFAGYSLYWTADESSDNQTKVMQQVAGGLMLLFAAVFLLMMIFLRKRIAIAIKVMEVAAKSLVDVPQLLTLPIFFQMFEIGVMIVFLYMTALMFSAADSKDKGTPQAMIDVTGAGVTNSYGEPFPEMYKRLDYDSVIGNLFWYHLFMMFWIITFSGYFLYTLMAGVFADWYFTRKDEHGKRVTGSKQDEMSPWPVVSAFRRTLVHSGTIAIASAIIAAVKTLRCFLAYMEKQAGKENIFAKYFSFCIQCALKCLECCVDAINKRALIMVAIVGEPFCKSATTAFGIIWRNLVRVAVMSAFTWIIILCGKVLVALIPTAMGLSFFQWYYEGEYDGVLAPGLAMLFVNWMVANSFMTVYEVSVDTIFLCFLIDEEANKESGTMFADPELRRIVDENADESKRMAEKKMARRDAAKNVKTDKLDRKADGEEYAV